MPLPSYLSPRNALSHARALNRTGFKTAGRKKARPANRSGKYCYLVKELSFEGDYCGLKFFLVCCNITTRFSRYNARFHIV